jgi:hypothetical protein
VNCFDRCSISITADINYKNGPISGCTTINFQKKLEDFFSNWKTSFSITYREKLESGPATIAIFPVDVLAILKNTYYVCYTNPQKDSINSIIRTGPTFTTSL